MTIEAKIDALIAALDRNTAAHLGKAAPAAPAKSAAKAEEPKKGLTYDDVKVPFLDLVKNKGREAGLAVLKEFGAEKLPDVKPADFEKVLAAIKKSATTTESALA